MTQIVLAHGAGAPSSSSWMRAWAERLGAFGDVVSFDYPYIVEGRRRPDPHERLVAAHRAAIATARRPLVLAGKSMGGRISCHVALCEVVAALVCFGYPLRSAAGQLRDRVLLDLRTPVLFLQGTRDKLCPLDELAAVRAHMTAASELHVVESGDHSLCASKAWLRDHGLTQREVDDGIAAAIARFLSRHVATCAEPGSLRSRPGSRRSR